MFLFDSNESVKTNKPKRSKSKQSVYAAEAKAAAKAKKIQQDDMDALQITFYEIESWIEKTAPVLNRMTKELDKASRHFNKDKITSTVPLPLPPPAVVAPTTVQQNNLDFSSMQWALSFQPGNSMRLETNIKSVEQLIEAVQKIRLLAENDEDDSLIPDLFLMNDHYNNANNEGLDDSTLSTSSSSSSCSTSSMIIVDPSIEYWNIAMYRRPHTCLEKYKYCDMNLSRLTEDVSPTVLDYICQTYWDCLHPKFSGDWNTFWDRSGDPHRNQVCIDSGLAMVFFHIIRHNKNACANAHAIAYYYYDRAREALMDYFDTPNEATIEALLNLSLFCVLCKRHSQSRIYMGLAYRMMHQLGLHRLSKLPAVERLQRKRYLKLFMVLYYNDISVSVYSGEPTLLDDSDCDIDFYEIITLNKQLIEHEEVNYDEKTIAKETFFVHLLELTRIGKCIQNLVKDYQRQNLQHHHAGTLPSRWVKKVQALEIALATWFDRLPVMYRVDPKPTRLFGHNSEHHNNEHDHYHRILDAAMLREQSGLLLMMQYQTQWITLHKTFLSPNVQCMDDDTNDLVTFSPLATTPYRTNRSFKICTDAANRIVVMSEIITERFDWCVCQQFISCVYQASTVFCKNVLNNNEKEASKAMIQRITSVLAASKLNYQGLPDDLTACLNDFLAENSNKDLDQILSCSRHNTTPYGAVVYNDKIFNSPHMFEQCLNQQVIPKVASLNRGPPSEAMLSIKIQNPSSVSIMDLEPEHKNWR
jgi:hypothetical protein